MRRLGIMLTFVLLLCVGCNSKSKTEYETFAIKDEILNAGWLDCTVQCDDIIFRLDGTMTVPNAIELIDSKNDAQEYQLLGGYKSDKKKEEDIDLTKRVAPALYGNADIEGYVIVVYKNGKPYWEMNCANLTSTDLIELQECRITIIRGACSEAKENMYEAKSLKTLPEGLTYDNIPELLFEGIPKGTNSSLEMMNIKNFYRFDRVESRYELRVVGTDTIFSRHADLPENSILKKDSDLHVVVDYFFDIDMKTMDCNRVYKLISWEPDT